MKKLVNTNLFPIISVGMYNSTISPENIFEDSCIDDDNTKGYADYNSEYYWDNFQNGLYEDKIQEIATDILDGDHVFNGITISIKCGAIYSPKYYNHSTDNMDLTVKFNKLAVLKYAKENKDSFNDFLKENYSSYDGFHSYTANNYVSWLQDFKNNDDQSIGAVLSYICKDDFEDMQDCFIHACFENLHYSEFCDTSRIDQEVSELQTYVQNNYATSKDFGNIPLELEFLNAATIKNKIKETIKGIESQTLKLEF